MKKIPTITTTVALGAALLGVMFFVSSAQAASPYTPFGGRVEEYIPQSDAQCVQNTCGKINKPVHEAIKNAISAPRNSFCRTFVAPLCSSLPVVGNVVCYGVCIRIINKSVEDSVNICNVEEIRVGPPRATSLGIVELGEIEIEPKLTIPIPFLPDITISIPALNFNLNIASILPGISDIIPAAKVYAYGEYKTKGNWVLGNSLNLRQLCVDAEEESSICNNPIAKVMIDALTGDIKEAGQEAFDDAKKKGLSDNKALTAQQEAEEERKNSCPLLNLLHQVGTSKSGGINLSF